MKFDWVTTVQNVLKEAIKNAAFKAALMKLFGTLTPVGFKAWLAKFVLERLWDWVIEEGIEIAVQKTELIVNKAKGEILVKKVRSADERKDESDWNDAVDDL